MTEWNEKCRFFNENYACDTLTTENLKSCDECKFSSPYDKKILIIKFGALGDVLRTTPILKAIRKKYPNSLIYWITLEESKELLRNNPYIDKLLIYNTESVLRLQQESFDILYSLEIATPATLLANIVNSREKHGYYFNNGSTRCFNPEAEEYLETAFLTHIKKQNRKTYQKLLFKACDLEFSKEEIIFELANKDKQLADEFKKTNDLQEDDRILGINFGSGKRWPTKAWAKNKLIDFIRKASFDYKIILFGGSEEEEEMKSIKSLLGDKIIIKNTKESITEFASIINICNKILTTDSLALQLATALKKPTVALFFSTPPWEIEDYGIVKKIASPLLEQHFFSNCYDEGLANSIPVEQVLKTIEI